MDKIWLKNYQQGVPVDINPDRYASLVEMFNESCQRFSTRPALVNYGVTVTFQQWARCSQQFAAYLQNYLGCQKGERFAIMLPNCLQYPIVLMGAFMAGMTVVNVNPLYTVPELIHQLNDSQATRLIVLANVAHTVEQALPKVNLKTVIVTQLGDLFPFPKSVLTHFILKYVLKKVPRYQLPRALSFNKVMKAGQKLTVKPINLIGEDIAFLQYTGGTTGVAKGTVLTHRNIVSNVEQAKAWVAPVMKEGEEIIVTPLPLYHIFSLLANCLLFMRLGGLNILITDPRNISHFISELRKYPFTAMTGVNTLYNALMNHADFTQLDFSKVKFVLGGGMAIQAPVAQRWQKITGKPLLEAYGLSETSPAATINPLNLQAYNGSIGLPISSTEVCFINEDEEIVPIGEVGELCVKGPQVMRGYWNNPTETEMVFTASGWLKTGDIGRMDENGFIYIVDRKKNIIIVSGFKVYPNEIESVISAYPGVLEVAVVGVPQPVVGEQVIAFVVKKDMQITEEAIIAYCHSKLTGYKVPKKIIFKDALPKSNVGKILHRLLRDEANK